MDELGLRCTREHLIDAMAHLTVKIEPGKIDRSTWKAERAVAIVVLHDVWGLSFDEIGRVFHRSGQNMRLAYARALRKMFRYLTTFKSGPHLSPLKYRR